MDMRLYSVASCPALSFRVEGQSSTPFTMGIERPLSATASVTRGEHSKSFRYFRFGCVRIGDFVCVRVVVSSSVVVPWWDRAWPWSCCELEICDLLFPLPSLAC